jgi:hypothetical protein
VVTARDVGEREVEGVGGGTKKKGGVGRRKAGGRNEEAKAGRES